MTENYDENTRFTFRSLILLLIPVILLAGVIALFLSTGGGLKPQNPPHPLKAWMWSVMSSNEGSIELHVRNTGPEEITIASVIINSAVMPFHVEPSANIPAAWARRNPCRLCLVAWRSVRHYDLHQQRHSVQCGNPGCI